MKFKFLAVLAAGLLVLGFFAAALYMMASGDKPPAADVRQSAGTSEVYKFPELSGPDAPTSIAKPEDTNWQRYSHGQPNRLALLLTDTNSAWLGLAHGLKSIGVPFIITTDYRIALQHRVVLVYPLISGKVLDADALRALGDFPKSGGTLIAVNVLGGGLSPVFGFVDAVPARTHNEVKFDRRQSLAAGFTDDKEASVRFAAAGGSAGSYEYSTPSNNPLAVYEDGTAAIVGQNHDRGHAYALGLDIGALLLIAYNNREEGIARSYVNDFEPGVDVILRLLRNMYVAGERDAVTLGTVPDGKSLAVVLTHDIDYTKSMANAVEYAQFEKSAGIRTTHFIQTKYVRDWNDDVFFNAQALPQLQALVSLGAEIGSHSVAHSAVFNKFALGTGTERYPAYQPFVKDQQHTDNGTVLGELRVSKFLLDHFTGQTVRSFRPGHLKDPYSLPQALVATGYRFSSSATANNSLTHLPFQLNYGRENNAELNVFEFPVTIEDEQSPKLGDRLEPAVALARKISRYHGTCVVLIHPDILDHKLEFERRFVDGVRDIAWFGSLSDLGQWWTVRNGIDLDVSQEGGRRIITLDLTEKISGLPLELPPDWKLASTEPADIRATQSGNQLILTGGAGRVKLVFAMR
jgi:hypothetical protein